MTNFERLTVSPEALGTFLASIPTTGGPWDEAFRKEFCAGCDQENCEPICPHQDKRNNPTWWLAQTAEVTSSDKGVTPRSRFKGLGEMTDDEINEFARRFYLAIQSMREAKQQQQQNS